MMVRIRKVSRSMPALIYSPELSSFCRFSLDFTSLKILTNRSSLTILKIFPIFGAFNNKLLCSKIDFSSWLIYLAGQIPCSQKSPWEKFMTVSNGMIDIRSKTNHPFKYPNAIIFLSALSWVVSVSGIVMKNCMQRSIRKMKSIRL